MNEYLADGSAIELSKEQLENYRQSNPLYMQERIKILESALDEIEVICNNIYSNGLDEEVNKFDDILYIINKAKKQQCAKSKNVNTGNRS